MKALKFSVGYIPTFLAAAGIAAGGFWSFAAPLILFGVAPLAELFMTGNEENYDAETEADIRNSRTFDWVLYLTVPLQFGLLAFFLYRVGFTPVVWWEVLGMALSMGMSCGILGINVGHELGHRRKKSEQMMAKALLLTSLYTHFFIEHNRGHHMRVATDDDPATARFGEWLYSFIPRSVIGGWLSAWELEHERLTAKGAKVYTWDNEMVRLQVLQLVFLAGIAAVFGWTAVAAFVLAAFVGGMLLETVNYLEHYGLARTRQEDGSYERVLPIHSWNSNLPLGRYILFELSRHSDHHAHTRRKYQTLRHFDYSPQLPTGYPGMMVLACIPPLWFAVMHRHMLQERERVLALGQRSAVNESVEALVAS